MNIGRCVGSEIVNFNFYLSFELRFPSNLNEVNANTVRYHQSRKVSNISRRYQKLQTLHCPHLWLLLKEQKNEHN